jgi:dinuclear metal center YbgI/SA1388 family protein
MILADIERCFEAWAPQWTAWERDTVGIQVGRRSQRVSRVLVALDITPAIIDEAIARKIDVIVTHHPLMFRPLSSLSDANPVGTMALVLAEKRIALFSAHTNLDSAVDGVSFMLARALGVTKPRFLAPSTDMLAKIAVFVPAKDVDMVSAAMAERGAGVIGEYESCSFRAEGKGTFRGSAQSAPTVGKPLRLEEVPEVKLEMIVPRARVDAVVTALKSVHPYEEVAYDVFALENSSPNFGMGAIGDLTKPVSLRAFLTMARTSLGAASLKHTGSLNQRVHRIAVCGGSGSELLEDAIRGKADVFVTADVRYHGFQAAHKRIVMVDAGHYETEQVVLPAIARRLESFAKSEDEKIVVTVTKQSTNPIHSF